MTDDWMNPSSWSYETPKNETVYVIERQRRVICFGTPGSITEWGEWLRYPTKEERDRELTRLRKEEPLWQLRAREYNPYLEHLGIGMGVKY